jgi:hypothetical protein
MMSERIDKRPSHGEITDRKWWKLPFDSTTNFSILGWLLDKLKGRQNGKKNVDLSLED